MYVAQIMAYEVSVITFHIVLSCDIFESIIFQNSFFDNI